MNAGIIRGFFLNDKVAIDANADQALMQAIGRLGGAATAIGSADMGNSHLWYLYLIIVVEFDEFIRRGSAHPVAKRRDAIGDGHRRGD